MQDRYTGDVGDFAKYGLLRQLLQPFAAGQSLRLAVLWYLIDNEDINSDGKHISYLRDDRIRACDPTLHDALTFLVHSGDRNVASLEKSGVLPLDRTIFFSVRLLSLNGRKQRDISAMEVRRRWFSLALAASEAADLVFLDPDNGIEVNSVPPSSSKSVKYVYLDEVAAILDRGQSLLIYQHHNRSAPAETQVGRTLIKLRLAAPQCTSATAVTFRRGSVRSFFLLSSKSHSDILQTNIRNLKLSAWRTHFSVTEG